MKLPKCQVPLKVTHSNHKGPIGKDITVNPRDLIYSFASIGASKRTIARLMDFDVNNFYINKDYSSAYEQGLSQLRVDLLTVQRHVAIERENTQMLIFLGKQYLSQSDKVNLSAEGDGFRVEFKISDSSDDERVRDLEARIKSGAVGESTDRPGNTASGSTAESSKSIGDTESTPGTDRGGK